MLPRTSCWNIAAASWVTSCDPDILSHDPTPVSRTAGASRRRVEWVRLFDFTRSPWVVWNSACLNALGILAGLAIAKLGQLGHCWGRIRFSDSLPCVCRIPFHVLMSSACRASAVAAARTFRSTLVLTSVLATDHEFRDRPAKSMKARLQTPGRKISVAKSANFAVAGANLQYLTRSVQTRTNRRLVPGLESGPRLYSCWPRTAARGCPQWEPRRPGGRIGPPPGRKGRPG